MSRKYFFCLLVMLLLWSSFTMGQTTISGSAYADYYYNFINHSTVEKDRNAFAFRRIYLTLDSNVNTDIKIRFRLESSHDNYGTSSKIIPFVKHAYLEWKNLIPNHKLYLGISATNTFKNSEEYWGYRSIEKTIMDLNKISPSADMGIAIKGDIGNFLHQWFMVSNGTGYGSSEVDRYKKIGYAIWLTPIKDLIIEAYADYENQNPYDPQTASIFKYASDYNGSSAYYTFKGFIGYKQDWFSLGTEAFLRTHKKSGIRDVIVENNDIMYSLVSDVTKVGYSVFGSMKTPIHKLKAFFRYDYFDPNSKDQVYTDFSDGQLTGGLNDESAVIFIGLDYNPHENIHLLPNMIVKKYYDNEIDNDMTGRITLYYHFISGQIRAD